MKIIMVLCLALVLSYFGYTQETYSTYTNSVTKLEYKIQISTKEDGTFSLFIDAMPMGNSMVEKGGFSIKSQQLQGFLNNLTFAYNKFIEWDSTAKANNVTSLRKEMDIKSQKISGYFLYGSDWKFDFLVKPTFIYSIMAFGEDENIWHGLLVYSGKMTASNNEFMDCEGFSLTFSNADEIKIFMELIDFKSIEEFINKPKTEDLFK
jgi:hypothetical protein